MPENKEIVDEMVGFIRGVVESGVTWQEVTDSIYDKFGVRYHESTIRKLCKKLGIAKTKNLTQLTSSPKIRFINEPTELTKEKRKKLLTSLRNKPKMVSEHAAYAKIDEGVVIREIEKLVEERYLVEWDGAAVCIAKHPQAERKPTKISLERLDGSIYRFAAISDTHLCSHYERLDCLDVFYDLCVEEGITDVYHAGNLMDGYAHGINDHEVSASGMDEQIKYTCINYPQRDGIKTRFITGECHMGWYTKREGIDVGRRLEQDAKEYGREDLVYLGHLEHDVQLGSGGPRIRLMHPGKGTSYAISYQTQKMAEAWTGGEKPEIAIVGHYHKMEKLFYRNVHIWQAGCFVDQSPWMRKQNIASMLGGWIIELHLDPATGAVVRTKSEDVVFYDKAYYQKKWKKIWAKDRILEPTTR